MRKINEDKQRAALALAKAREAIGSLTTLDDRVTALETALAALDWQSTTFAALANTYFTIESLGTINAGETWHIDIVAGGSKKPAAAPTTRQATTVRLLGSVTRPSTGAAATVAYTTTADGGTLAGWSTGVRLAMNGNVVQLEGRVTTADTVHIRWRSSVAVEVIS